MLAPLRLKAKEERRLKAGHLWIYSNEVDTQVTPLKELSPGQQVRVEAHNGKAIASAYVNPQCLLLGRVYSRIPEQALDANLIRERLKQALHLRQAQFDEPYYRLVFGDSDGLPGLVVDRFGEHLVAQITTAGMDAVKGEVVEQLDKLLAPKSLLFRNDSSTRELEGLSAEVSAAIGEPPQQVELQENGVRFNAPIWDGQKTGWFYDHRCNRAALKALVKGKRVLDVFSYLGAFGVQAAAFGAAEVWCVDASETALDQLQTNAELNGVGDRITTVQGDAFAALKSLKENGERFDVVILDPPAFIKRKKDHKNGLNAYRRINELAIRLLAKEGYLLTASCSMHLARNELHEVVRASLRHLDKEGQIIHQGFQGPDHPVHPAIPETEYIKSLLVRIIGR